jgi:heme/copper-type cytochrome/quinol oxidase subunit 1
MYDTTTPNQAYGFTSWPRRAESWLDERGKMAWIAAMVLGFIFVWPVGLALLAYMIWSKRMFNRSACRNRSHAQGMRWKTQSTGNSAFDFYRSETIRRLEEEQDAFEAFLKRLRDAKDKTEFDTFMEERATKNADENNAKDLSTS